MHSLDVLLVSETHCTTKSLIKIKKYVIYHTNHPDGTGHGGTAVIIKASIKHHLLQQFATNHIQATSVLIEDKNGDFTVSSIYCPPRHKITEQLFNEYFITLGERFIAGGDWNAKHVQWAARLTTTRGRELKKSIDCLHLRSVATSEPTYWPADRGRLPDVLDFFVLRGLSRLHYSIEASLDGSSDHTPVFLTLSTTILYKELKATLYNKYTDWESFKDLVNDKLNLKISLKSEDDIDTATKEFTSVIQNSLWNSTPEIRPTTRQRPVTRDIKNKILEKRRLRRRWHCSQHPLDKRAYNRSMKELKDMLKKEMDATTAAYVGSLSATSGSNYSLWKACRKTCQPVIPKPPIRAPGNVWAKTTEEKANAFAIHLAKIFSPNDSDGSDDADTEVDQILYQDLQMDLPIKPTSPREVRENISLLGNKKSPGFDLIDKKVLQELPKKAIVYLTALFNGILRTGCYPALWKVSQIVMVPKPGKPVHDLTSYRPISLLPVPSKLFEKILLRRILHELSKNSILPDHQFGFRKEHATTEQIHRVYRTIRNSLENKEYCSAAFLDIQQAFDKVWHKGLLCKIKSSLSHSYYHVLQSYLSGRMFQVKEGESTSMFQEIQAGVPQGSILGPVLYTIFTADLPQSSNVTIATYADDTAILASNDSPAEASRILQQSLWETHRWLRKWRIRASATKSVHVTFGLRKGDCPPVKLGNHPLPHCDVVKYLGIHLDRKLTWRKHLQIKRDELNLKYRRLYWLLGRNSRLSLDNKLLIYKTTLKPIWTYGIQLWGSACISSIQLIQRAEDSILKQIANTPWFIRNQELHDNLEIKTVKEEINLFSKKYRDRVTHHPNILAAELAVPDSVKRLKRRNIWDLCL